MNAAIKRVGIVAGTLFVLALVAAIAISVLFDPNDYKGFAADWVQSRTGRQLDIEGDLQLSFFPWLAVNTGRLVLSNAEGFQPEPFATVDSAGVRVKLLPLLGRRFEVGMVELDGLILNLARDAEGRGNWQDLLDSDDGAAPSTATDQSSSPLDDVQIAGLRLDEAAIYWRENVSDVRYIARNLSLTTGALEPGEPMDLALAVNLLSVEPQFNLDLELETTARIDGALDEFAAQDLKVRFDLKDSRDVSRAQGTLASGISGSLRGGLVTVGATELSAALSDLPGSAQDLELNVSWAEAALALEAQTVALQALTTNSADITASWELTGQRILDSPEFAGRVTMQTVPWTRALALAGIRPPDNISADDLGTFDLSSAFTYQVDGGGIRLTDTSLRTLGFEATGEVVVAAANRLTGRVAIASFPADRLIRATAAALPDTLDTDAIGELAMAARFDVDISADRLSLREATAQLLGATFRGELDGSGAPGARVYTGKVNAPRFDGGDLAMTFAPLLPENLSARELGPLAIDTGFSYRAASDELTLAGLTLETLGLEASGELTAHSFSEAPRWTGRLTTKTFSPRDLMTRFGQAVPETADAKALTRATVATQLSVTSRGGQFTGMRLKLDDSVIRGEFSVDNFDNPSYGFQLTIDEVDVDRYLPPKAAPAEGSAAKTADQVEIPKDALSTLNLKGQVEVDSMRLAGLSFGSVNTGLETGAGLASLNSARANLYGGSFDGSLSVNARGAVPAMTLQGTATAVELEPLLVALRGESSVRGTGSFDLALAGRGNTVVENMQTAEGNVEFALRNGAVTGFNLGHVLCRVYNAQQKLSRPSADVPEITNFSVMRGAATVREGIATSQAIEAASSFLAVTGSGSIDLVNQGLNYDLVAKLTNSIDIKGCETMDSVIGESIPFTVGGTISQPKVQPDFGKILQRAIRRRLEDRLKDRLMDRLGLPQSDESDKGSAGGKAPPAQ